MSVKLALAVSDNKTVRRTVNYHPSIWGDRFTTYVCDDEAMKRWREEAEELKEKVRKMLTDHEIMTTANLPKKLKLIDAVQRLGVSYHFEQEIDELLEQIFINHKTCVADYNLHDTALLFRLQRQQGYKVSCDVFKKFRDSKGSFKEDSVAGTLSLYEAAHLRVHGEDILDEALDFTTRQLNSVLITNLSHPLAKQIQHALRRPIRKSTPRLEAWHYTSFYYKESESHDENLLKFAKLDFNILQKMHQKEMSILARWWKDLDFKRKLPWARDRLPECYLWILEVYYQPQYATSRMFATQVIALTSIIDDIYDVYGTHEELVLFTEAMERMDISAIDQLPEYMKPCYQALLDVYGEMEEKISGEGNSYQMGYAKEAMRVLIRAYFEETKWLNRGDIPTYEEYIKVAQVSSAYPMLSITSMIGMGDRVGKEDFDWILTKPKIIEAASIICRLMDDMVSHKFEQQRDHIPSAVECYAYQHGVSGQQACEIFDRHVVSAWKDINEAFLRPTPARVSVLTRILNLSRVIDVLYSEEDGYTHSTRRTKDIVACMLINPVEI
ncbi:hypothetical protein Dimus_012571 [Dionaea muscipula]